MIKSRFDDLMKSLRSRSTSKGPLNNPVAEAAKVLEVNYTIRQVDQELQNCKCAIVENMRSYEAAAVTLARLEDEREKIATSRDRLSDFAANTRQKMAKIAEARDAFLPLLNDDEDDRKFDREHSEQIGDAIRRINDERDVVLADLGTVGQSVESLEAKLRDLEACIKQQRAENAAFHATLKQKRKDVVSRNRKTLARYYELLKSKDQRERGGGIKVEKNADF